MTDRNVAARSRIFAKVRSGLGASAKGQGEERRAAVEQRLSRHARHLIPQRVVAKSMDELVALLRRWLETAGGDVIEAANETDVPACVADYLRQHNLPARVRTGDDPFIAGLPWSSEPALELTTGRAAADEQVGLTHALAAIAETGTLVVASGAANPVTLSFLPETNIVLVRRGDVVGPLEEAWARTRGEAAAGGGLPRTVNLISGPSRSADIGGIPVLGAHGPRRLCVIVVG